MPPDAVEPLFRQIVNQFVHDRSRTEVLLYCVVITVILMEDMDLISYASPCQAITVGLNVVREICLRIPLVCSIHDLVELFIYIHIRVCIVLLLLGLFIFEPLKIFDTF